ncbi:MAG: hypothetical protein CL525_00250 [Aequorivita sp.]|nr:hypothetical protein [Aequorivita sp.]|tara:strand:+ start:443 stop:664 length:222 start_codon:yes stop_codon:yes gene_type:complete
MDRVVTNADFRAETTRVLKQLKHQLDVISSDISSIKRDIFLLKTIKEVKKDTIKVEPEPEPEPKKSEGWWWGY